MASLSIPPSIIHNEPADNCSPFKRPNARPAARRPDPIERNRLRSRRRRLAIRIDFDSALERFE